MKKLIFSAGLIALSAFNFAPTFCEGWDDGYGEGYCDEMGPCVKPVSPVCPVPRVGEDSYRGGYNRGFKAGYKANERHE